MSKLAYKVFEKDWLCRGHDFKNEKGEVVGTVHKIDKKPILCEIGFHYCKKLVDCFNYYNFNSKNKVALIEILGEIDAKKGHDKECTNVFKIVKEITWFEVLEMCNTGHMNTGNRNAGDRNTGGSNTGHMNTGNMNTGNRNTGDWNAGNWNTGDWNTGNSNTGHMNTGDWNTGDRNTGDRNTGDWNTGDWNTGYFNTTTPIEINIFNKPFNLKEWNKIEKPNFLYFNLTEWVDIEGESSGGYLKKYTYKEAFRKSYLEAKKLENFKLEFEKLINLPNFDKEIFKEISGIDIDID